MYHACIHGWKGAALAEDIDAARMTNPDPWRTAADAFAEQRQPPDVAPAISPSRAVLDAAVDAVARGFITPELRAAVLVMRPGMAVPESVYSRLRAETLEDAAVVCEALATGGGCAVALRKMAKETP